MTYDLSWGWTRLLHFILFWSFRLFRNWMTYNSLYLRYRKKISSSSCVFCFLLHFIWGQDGSIGIATRMGWTVQGSNPGGGQFSASVQTGPGTHTASCTMGTGAFPEVKHTGLGVVYHHPPSSAEVKERVELCYTTLMSLRGLFLGELYLPFTCILFTSRPNILFRPVIPRCFLKNVTWISGKCHWRVLVNKHRYFADHWRFSLSVTSSRCEHRFNMRSSADKTPTHDKRCILRMLRVVRSCL